MATYINDELSVTPDISVIIHYHWHFLQKEPDDYRKQNIVSVPLMSSPVLLHAFVLPLLKE